MTEICTFSQLDSVFLNYYYFTKTNRKIPAMINLTGADFIFFIVHFRIHCFPEIAMCPLSFSPVKASLPENDFLLIN